MEMKLQVAKEDGLWCFSAPFNNIPVSFIGGENWSTRKKPLTCRKSLTNFIT